MPEAYIVDAVRAPVGRRGGGLAHVHPADLGAHSLTALMERTGVDPSAVEDVVFGCVDTIGPQAGDIARTAWLAAGLPEHVPGVTVDRQCGSSQQAVHFAAQAVMAELIGIIDMFWTPPATTRSLVPLSTAWAAKCTACCDEPHCRSIVTPGTDSGRPAARAAVRAMSPAWAPMASRQP